jgi:hypothetical protein
MDVPPAEGRFEGRQDAFGTPVAIHGQALTLPDRAVGSAQDHLELGATNFNARQECVRVHGKCPVERLESGSINC